MSWNLDRIKVRKAIKDKELTTIHAIALNTGVPDTEVAKIIRVGVKIGTLDESEIDHIIDWKEDQSQYKTADEWLKEE